mgnify:CR=1 FL=1|jgi:hypothetical protein
MIRKTVSLLDRNGKYLDIVANVLNTSVSQVVSDMIDYIRKNNQEDSIWSDWVQLYDDYKESLGKAFDRAEEVDITPLFEEVEDLDVWKGKREEEEEE